MAPTYRTRWPLLVVGSVVVSLLAVLLSDGLRRALFPEPTISVAHYAEKQETAICTSLSNLVPGTVYSTQHSTYHNFISTFWSLNAAAKRPDCIVQPTNAQDVSTIVKHLKENYEQDDSIAFAVRSGGHSPEAGFSTIDDGVVIDMSLINGVAVSRDRASATIGVGARWVDVYSKLDSMGLGVVGGRDSGVGVGGLVLGGGVSYFSPRFGMVCDNIDQYEIVIANGSILQASAHEHADLWRALKGGTGNFGIVTRIVAKTFVSGDIWAGYAYWPGSQINNLLHAFHDFNEPRNFDAYAGGTILATNYVQKIGMRIATASIVYTKPEAWPPVFQGFRRLWRFWSTMKIQSLTETAHELRSLAPSGLRQFQITTTIKNDLQTFRKIEAIFTEKMKEVTHVTGGIWSLVFQPLSAAVTRKGNPNVLELETRHVNDTLIIVLLSISYQNIEDTQLTQRVAREVIALSEDYAKGKGTWDPYIYLNYAASGQDIYGGYGAANRAFLAETRRRYDPDGFFQKCRQGGFKLPM